MSALLNASLVGWPLKILGLAKLWRSDETGNRNGEGKEVYILFYKRRRFFLSFLEKIAL